MEIEGIVPERGITYHPSDERSWKSLVFDTDKEAYEFYCIYAKKCGFSIRKGYSVKRDSRNQPIEYSNYLKYDCHKQGFKKESPVPEGVVVHRREVTRTGCTARMKLKMNLQKGGYVITEWLDYHNHPLIDAEKAHFLPSNRAIHPAQQDVIDQYLSAGIAQRSIYEAMCLSAGGRHNIGFNRVDLKNYIQSKRQREMKPGEAIVMLNWFREQKSEDPAFYYDIQVDEDNQISSLFWADRTMRADYSVFGDFVSFDTTYRTNKKYMPLGMFVGFNHHKGTCIFGGALLYDEKISSFTWLFNSFLKCMNRRMPVTVMTDQAPAIAAAIRSVFPEVFHGLCSWHIQQNATKKLGARANARFFDEFNHLIHHVATEDQFEFAWSQMLSTCFDNRHNSDISWLNFIYSSRKHWSSAWVKSYFTAGKTTTQLSEQLNAFARSYLKPDLSISQFFIRFQAMLDDLRQNELKSDFQMVNRVAPNKFTTSTIMVHAAQIYTPNIFDIFSKEYEAAQSFTLQPMPHLQRGSTQVVHTRRRMDPIDVNSDILEEEVVEIDPDSLKLACSCRFYDNRWILCRHILKVMDGFGSWGHAFCQRIPEHYIKDRWTRSVKKPPAATSVSNVARNPQSNYSERYQRLCGVMVGVGTRICSSEAAYNLFITKVIEAAKEASLLNQPTCISSDPVATSSATVIGHNEGVTSTEFKKRHNPCTSKRRLKSAFEKRHLEKKRKYKEAMKLLPTV